MRVRPLALKDLAVPDSARQKEPKSARTARGAAPLSARFAPEPTPRAAPARALRTPRDHQTPRGPAVPAPCVSAAELIEQFMPVRTSAAPEPAAAPRRTAEAARAVEAALGGAFDWASVSRLVDAVRGSQRELDASPYAAAAAGTDGDVPERSAGSAAGAEDEMRVSELSTRLDAVARHVWDEQLASEAAAARTPQAPKQPKSPRLSGSLRKKVGAQRDGSAAAAQLAMFRPPALAGSQAPAGTVVTRGGGGAAAAAALGSALPQPYGGWDAARLPATFQVAFARTYHSRKPADAPAGRSAVAADAGDGAAGRAGTCGEPAGLEAARTSAGANAGSSRRRLPARIHEKPAHIARAWAQLQDEAARRLREQARQREREEQRRREALRRAALQRAAAQAELAAAMRGHGDARGPAGPSPLRAEELVGSVVQRTGAALGPVAAPAVAPPSPPAPLGVSVRTVAEQSMQTLPETRDVAVATAPRREPRRRQKTPTPPPDEDEGEGDAGGGVDDQLGALDDLDGLLDDAGPAEPQEQPQQRRQDAKGGGGAQRAERTSAATSTATAEQGTGTEDLERADLGGMSQQFLSVVEHPDSARPRDERGAGDEQPLPSITLSVPARPAAPQASVDELAQRAMEDKLMQWLRDSVLARMVATHVAPQPQAQQPRPQQPETAAAALGRALGPRALQLAVDGGGDCDDDTLYEAAKSAIVDEFAALLREQRRQEPQRAPEPPQEPQPPAARPASTRPAAVPAAAERRRQTPVPPPEPSPSPEPAEEKAPAPRGPIAPAQVPPRPPAERKAAAPAAPAAPAPARSCAEVPSFRQLLAEELRAQTADAEARRAQAEVLSPPPKRAPAPPSPSPSPSPPPAPPQKPQPEAPVRVVEKPVASSDVGVQAAAPAEMGTQTYENVGIQTSGGHEEDGRGEGADKDLDLGGLEEMLEDQAPPAAPAPAPAAPPPEPPAQQQPETRPHEDEELELPSSLEETEGEGSGGRSEGEVEAALGSTEAGMTTESTDAEPASSTLSSAAEWTLSEGEVDVADYLGFLSEGEVLLNKRPVDHSVLLVRRTGTIVAHEASASASALRKRRDEDELGELSEGEIPELSETVHSDT
eukprot:m51a1_g5296 hypothetical protein (1106) ;mRNA; f:223493-227773